MLSVRFGRALWLGQAVGFAGAIGVILSQAGQAAFEGMQLLAAIAFGFVGSIFYIWLVPVLSIVVITPYLLVRPRGPLQYVLDVSLVVVCTYIGAMGLESFLMALPGTSPTQAHLFYAGLKGSWAAIIPLTYWASGYRRI